MLVFATSDKGGTGRSVTSSNVAYRSALSSRGTCYLDFDFGSPTAGAIFQISGATNGIAGGGLHSYIQGRVGSPEAIDIWSRSDRQSLRQRPPGSGRLVLYPGDHGGSEFVTTPEMNRRCAELFLRLEEEFDVIIVDLSAGRSYATDMVLAATAMSSLRKVTQRWLVFHRWTRQHVGAAAGLVYDDGGILEVAERHGHDPEVINDSLRFVRTAVIDPYAEELSTLRPAQVAFLRDCDRDLNELASNRKVGRTKVIASVPLDPLLQWREQLISDNDLYERKIGNVNTVTSFECLAASLMDDQAWEVV
jgi:hypothetical protein